MDEIRAAIAEADTVVAVMSAWHLARSSICAAELDHAVTLHKRVVPVVVRETPTELLPQELRDSRLGHQPPPVSYASAGILDYI